MGNCRYCSQFTQQHCLFCKLYACTQHIKMHYLDPRHKRAEAAARI